MGDTAEAGVQATPATDLAALSTALIVAHAWAMAHPEQMSEVYSAGYQRSIQWKMRKTRAGTWEHLIVLRREHLSPHDLDHENVSLALQGSWDRMVGELAVVDRRPMDEADPKAGVCYRVCSPPAPPPPEEAP